MQNIAAVDSLVIGLPSEAGKSLEDYSAWDIDDYPAYSIPFTTSISEEYWISSLLLTKYHLESLLGEDSVYVQAADKLPLKVTWLEAIKICTALNEIYQSQLPRGYFISLPTEIQWEYAARQNAFSELTITNTNLDEWCFDPLATYPTGLHKDWHGGVSENNLETTIEEGLLRMIRFPRKNTIPLREPFHYSYFENCFRLCIRPLTEHDKNDILLKNLGISLV
jgi:hypothetical protein